MDRLTAQLIQAYPNLQDVISAKVEQEALKLAARRADLEREAALVYAKAFTADELKQITAFYGSETGKKLLKDGPIATRELLKAADIWTAGVARDLEKQANDALLAEVQTSNRRQPKLRPKRRSPEAKSSPFRSRDPSRAFLFDLSLPI